MPYHYDHYSRQYYEYDDVPSYETYAYDNTIQRPPELTSPPQQQYPAVFTGYSSTAPPQPVYQYNFQAPNVPVNDFDYTRHYNQVAFAQGHHNLYQPYERTQSDYETNFNPPQRASIPNLAQPQPRVIVPPSPSQRTPSESHHTSPAVQISNQIPGSTAHAFSQQEPEQSHFPQTTRKSSGSAAKADLPNRFPVNLPPKPSPEEQKTSTNREQLNATPASRSVPIIQVPPRQNMPKSRVLQDATSNTPRQQSASKPQMPQPSFELSTQGPSMLLTLADEYINAAKKLEARNKDYYVLVSTALGCLEMTLNNFKLTPLREAQLSLRYAQLLHEETTNVDEAESVLSKAIGICERMSYVDLKYALQLLLAKVLFDSKPKAAMRDLTEIIKDLEAYRHSAWEYAFRFQAVFFHMSTPTASNLHDAVHHLERIQQTAKLSSDHMIYVFAALLQALIHLNDTAQDSMVNAQSALAKARSLQLNPEIENHPQIVSLIDILDVLCCLISEKVDTEQLLQRRKNMARTIANSVQRGPNWTKDELMWLRVNTSSTKGVPSQEGGLVQEMDGKLYIALEWMGKLELEGVGYLINALCWSMAGRAGHEKAVEYMRQGYKIPNLEIFDPEADEETKQQPPRPILVKDKAYRDRAHLLAAHYQAETALMKYALGSLNEAMNAVKAIGAHIDKISKVPPAYQALLDYLRGCVYQANGDLKKAVKHYQSISLQLPQKAHNEQSTTHKSHQATLGANFLLELQLLAAMNLANIIRDPTHPQHMHLQSLVNNISAYMTTTSPAKVRSSYNVLMSVLPTDTTTLQTKQLLSTAMYIGRDTKNHQITSVALAMIQDRFFRGGVQDATAVKSARATMLTIRDKWQNVLWWAVAGNMELESILLQIRKGNGPQKGTPEYEERMKEVKTKYKEIHAAWAKVPDKVKDVMLQ